MVLIHQRVWATREGLVIRRAGPEGRIVIDACTSDAEHLAAPAAEERRKCRIFLDDIIPEDWLGKRGRVRITVLFEED